MHACVRACITNENKTEPLKDINIHSISPNSAATNLLTGGYYTFTVFVGYFIVKVNYAITIYTKDRFNINVHDLIEAHSSIGSIQTGSY